MNEQTTNGPAKSERELSLPPSPGSAPWWYKPAAPGSAQEAWEARSGPLEYDSSEGYNAMPPNYEWGWHDGRKPLLGLLRECLPYLNEVCELDPVGGPDDNCGVHRAEMMRDSIHSVLQNVEARQEGLAENSNKESDE